MSIELLELYKEYLDILIKKKKKGIEFDEVEEKFIKAIEEFDRWFAEFGVKKYI